MSKENQKLKTGLAKAFMMANAHKNRHRGKSKNRAPKKVKVIYIGGRTYTTLVNADV